MSTEPDAGANPEDPIAELAPTLELACERIGGGLRSLLLFGSCLSPATRRAGRSSRDPAPPTAV